MKARERGKKVVSEIEGCKTEKREIYKIYGTRNIAKRMKEGKDQLAPLMTAKK